jgi:anti-sigma factor RsiW
MSPHFIEAEELMAQFDGELPAERAASTAAHVRHCAECQNLAADLQDVSQRMALWKIEPTAVGMSAVMTAELEKRQRRSMAIPGRASWLWRLFCAKAGRPPVLNNRRPRRGKDIRKA